MRIILTGGGTGGHIYPALAFANYLKTVEPELEILYIGTQKGLENKIVPAAGIPFKTIDIQGFRRSLSLENFRTVAKFLTSTRQARKIIKDFAPDIVMGTGGYVAGPVVYAASKLGIPTLIHEGNSVPGITNRFLASRVSRIAVGFHAAEPHFSKGKTFFTGNPRAQEIADSAKNTEKFPEKTVVIFGGSRGALTLNEAFIKALPELAEADFKTIYASGEIYYNDYKATFEKYQDNPNIDIRPYINNMIELLSKSHLFLGRSGSTTIAEVTALGLPAIYVPSPNVTADQQTRNAQEYVDQGAAEIIKDSDLTGEALVSAIKSIFADEQEYQTMAENSRKAGVPDASSRLYQLVKEITK